jgi:hypothetical protein
MNQASDFPSGGDPSPLRARPDVTGCCLVPTAANIRADGLFADAAETSVVA